MKEATIKTKCIFIITSLLISFYSFGHGDENHSKEQMPIEVQPDEVMTEIYKEINFSYLASVKPIFKTKCLDCHGTGNQKPWYYVVPGPKQLMNRDISKAREHMDMSNDFPFGGHASPNEDLEELLETVKNDTMPPWQYKLMHWSSSLTSNEKKIVKDWIKESLIKIKQGDVE